MYSTKFVSTDKQSIFFAACDLFSVEGNSVILKPEYKGRDKDGRSPALEKFSETMEEGSSNSWTAVLIPADTRYACYYLDKDKDTVGFV